MQAFNGIAISFLVGFTLLIPIDNAASSTNEKREAPRVLDGFIDLSNWDPDRERIIHLDGNWGFSWGKFLTVDDILNLPTPPLETIQVPSKWIYKPDGTVHPFRKSFGYGTYFLRVKFGSAAKNFNSQIALLSESLCQVLQLHSHCLIHVSMACLRQALYL